MRITIFLFTFVLLLTTLSSPAWSQVITSTTDGGDWKDPDTWVGGVVPDSQHEVVIDGTVSMGSSAEIRSLIVNPEGILQSKSTFTVLTVDSYVENHGTIRDHADGARFDLDVGGDIRNYGTWTSYSVWLIGIGYRTIDLRGADTYVFSNDDIVIFVGENYLPNLTIQSNVYTSVSSNSLLHIDGSISSFGTFENFGSVTMTRATDDNAIYRFLDGRAWVTGGIDTLHITTHGNQVPETFGDAVWSSWWSVESVPKSDEAVITNLRLRYDPEKIGDKSEDELEVFYAEDEEQAWTKISTETNLWRDWENNHVTLIDAPANGRYLLSSDSEPVSVRPSSVLSIIGRSEIRIGPPNRYKIYYYNNSPVSTGDMILQLHTEGGVHIEAVEPSSLLGEDVGPIIPVDSLTYDGEDTTVYLWVRSMAPMEARTFDVFLRAFPDGAKQGTSRYLANDSRAEPSLVSRLWKASRGLNVPNVVVDFTANFMKDIWGQLAGCETFREALLGSLVTSAGKASAKAFFGEKSAKAIAEDASDELAKRIPGVVPLMTSKNRAKTIFDAIGEAHSAAIQYKYGGLIVPDCHGDLNELFGDISDNGMDLQKITSWDPNEKAGPSGYGEEGFISSAGQMTYQIYFENVDTADAPAYRVLIVDTLSDAFDPETVEFGPTSHEGPDFDWSMTRNGNVLRWEIEGIELVPNVNPPEGEGHVTFSVETRPDLTSGTELRNGAEIIFDFNPPIRTDDVVNTLDFDPPVTAMRPLADETDGPEIEVQWDSGDGPGGAGVESVALYASKDGGGFQPVGTTDQNALTVPVEPGSTYSFYALARDNVGNVERIRPDVVETTISTSVGVEEEGLPEYTFRLNDNYPNPFNPSTTISFTLPHSGNTMLVVYNMLGQLVDTIIDGEQKAGHHSVQWNASRLASGMYFYRLTHDDMKSTKHMMLVK